MRERSPNAIGGGFFSMIIWSLAAWALFVYLLVNVAIPVLFPPEFGEPHVHIRLF